MMLNGEFIILRQNTVNFGGFISEFILKIFFKIYKIDDSNCALTEAYENSPIPITQNECTSHSYETVLSSPNHNEASAEVGFVCFSYTKDNEENYKKCLM